MENTLKSHLIALMATEFLPLTPELAQKAWDFMVVWWENTFVGHHFNWNQTRNQDLDNLAPVFVEVCEELIMDILMSIA